MFPSNEIDCAMIASSMHDSHTSCVVNKDLEPIVFSIGAALLNDSKLLGQIVQLRTCRRSRWCCWPIVTILT
jgi:hypothetical protein